MSAERWRNMAKRMLDGQGGSTIQWTRRSLTSNGAAGTVTEGTPTTYDIRAAAIDARSTRLFSAESWQTSQVRLVIAAEGLPFSNETHSGFPEVRFEDTVEWLGVTMRVVFFDTIAAPGGPGLPPQPAAYFVGLAA